MRSRIGFLMFVRNTEVAGTPVCVQVHFANNLKSACNTLAG